MEAQQEVRAPLRMEGDENVEPGAAGCTQDVLRLLELFPVDLEKTRSQHPCTNRRAGHSCPQLSSSAPRTPRIETKWMEQGADGGPPPVLSRVDYRATTEQLQERVRARLREELYSILQNKLASKRQVVAAAMAMAMATAGSSQDPSAAIAAARETDEDTLRPVAPDDGYHKQHSIPTADHRPPRPPTAEKVPVPPIKRARWKLEHTPGVELVRINHLKGLPQHNRRLMAGIRRDTGSWEEEERYVVRLPRGPGGKRIRPAAWRRLCDPADAISIQRAALRRVFRGGSGSGSGSGSVSGPTRGKGSVEVEQFFRSLQAAREGDTADQLVDEEVALLVERVVQDKYGKRLSAEDRAEAERKLREMRQLKAAEGASADIAATADAGLSCVYAELPALEHLPADAESEFPLSVFRESGYGHVGSSSHTSLVGSTIYSTDSGGKRDNVKNPTPLQALWNKSSSSDLQGDASARDAELSHRLPLPMWFTASNTSQREEGVLPVISNIVANRTLTMEEAENLRRAHQVAGGLPWSPGGSKEEMARGGDSPPSPRQLSPYCHSDFAMSMTTVFAADQSPCLNSTRGRGRGSGRGGGRGSPLGAGRAGVSQAAVAAASGGSGGHVLVQDGCCTDEERALGDLDMSRMFLPTFNITGDLVEPLRSLSCVLEGLFDVVEEGAVGGPRGERGWWRNQLEGCAAEGETAPAKPLPQGFSLDEAALRLKVKEEVREDLAALIAERDRLRAEVEGQRALQSDFLEDIARLSRGGANLSPDAFAIELTREVNQYALTHSLQMGELLQHCWLEANDKLDASETLLKQFVAGRQPMRSVGTQVTDDDLGYVNDGVRDASVRLQDIFFHERKLREAVKLATVAVANIMSLHASMELELTCRECFFLFENPRTLWPCGHTFCQQCLAGMYNQDDDLICGECGSVCEVGYTPNLTMELIASYQVIQEGHGWSAGLQGCTIENALRKLLSNLLAAQDQFGVSLTTLTPQASVF